MTVSVILNLSPQALADGRLAGSVELVSTGERRVVKDAAELIGFLQGHGADEPRGSDAR